MSAPAPLHTIPRAPRGWLACVGVVTAAVLAVSLPLALFDTNFYSLFEATGLLAGDHPYRDFFEWGIPLPVALSAAAQRLVGYRMVGEFVLIHWTAIIAGAMLSFAIGHRLTQSAPVSALMALLALTVLPDTPTFHYPKLFLYPLAVWLGLRYMDAPTAARAAVLGIVTALAFLFRHDHGLYVGAAAVLAWGLSRWTSPRPRPLLGRDGAVFSGAAAALLAPWLVLVQVNEGVVDYVRSRSELYDMWSAHGTYRALLFRSPLRLAEGWTPPAPRAAVVSFDWEPPISDADRTALERRLGLRPLSGSSNGQQWRYEVDNVYDLRLLDLAGRINDASGLDMNRLRELGSWLPTLEPARTLLAQVTLVVPFLLLGAVGFDVARARRLGTPVRSSTYGTALGAVFLIVVDARLFREPSYAHLVAPLTAALAARFFTTRGTKRAATWARLTAATGVFVLCGYAGAACLQPTRVLTRPSLQSVPRVAGRLVSSPPIDAFVTLGDVREWADGQDRDAWNSGAVPGAFEILLRYLHDCTAAGDHVFVSGSTPYHINYLIERPLAGGHLFWRHGWRRDPRHEAQSLALLQRQSVPFALSTSAPVFEELAPYPRLHEYFMTHYTVFPGSNGRLLIDSRRTPAGRFGPFDFPCFK
jgi:hypothetical protein